MFLPRTDLAIEASAFADTQKSKKIPGVISTNYNQGDISVTKVIIENEDGEKAIGKPMGTYVTIECQSLRDLGDMYDKTAKEVFQNELYQILKPYECKNILVAGLGNRFVTPDSLGPRVSDEITAKEGKLCTISPGVLGITGIETEKIVEGISEKVKPDVVIAIDALATRSISRICTTIQIADTGITPGGGVGNCRKALTEKTLGVPVIAVGVPTVVDASTVAYDALGHMISVTDKTNRHGEDEEKMYSTVKEILNPFFGELIVTPSQIDCVITKVASLIADGINELAHKNDAGTI